MKIRALVILTCRLVSLEAADRQISGQETPPPGYEKVELLDVRGATILPIKDLPSSPSSNVIFNALSAAAGFFVSSSPVAVPETESQKMWRTMQTAVVSQDDERLQELLRNSVGVRCAQVCSKDDKRSPFHTACLSKYVNGIKIFFQAGVPIDILNEEVPPQTALQVALNSEKESDVVVVQTLVELGSSVGDSEVTIVRDLCRKKGKDDTLVQRLAELLKQAKANEIHRDIFGTGAESAAEAEEDN